MPENNTFETLNNKIKALNKAVKSTEILWKGLDVANEIMHILGIPYNELEEGEDMLEKAFPNSKFNNQKVEKWFAANPIIDGARVALNHYDKGTYPIESKFYMLSDSPRKEKIAYTSQLFPNWEDGEMYMIPQYKVGVDFFLNPKTKSLLFVVTRKGILRVVEFSGKLSHTQIEILNKIQNCALYDGIDIKTRQPIPYEPQRTIHNTLWTALELKEVNKKFYIGIAEHFALLCQYLKDHVPAGVDPSTIDNTSRIFANRIINRLLFVWFLRKKEIINKDYNYFDIGEDDSATYYENKLKPLFFNTLNVPVEDRELTADSVTPYLNGGLFEAHETDWPNFKVPFPNGWFNSLYEHLDKFNFTTDESSAEYEQVAIDPEMLGRVFENLLASIVSETASAANERNNKGAFYTPREIVSYMCKISLKEYFKRKVSSDKFYEPIDKLIDLPDNLYIYQKSTGQSDVLGVNSTQIRSQLAEAVNELKILDPACGSGAFPIGMLQLLLKTCERLSLIYDEKIGKMRLISGTEVTNTYQTKLFLIRNCLYGVDIEPMAAEISRLRAWLSLIIDDKTDIEPLPNLDFNFVCANTLVKLPPKSEQGDFFIDDSYEERFQKLREQYFNTHEKKAKDELRNKFYDLYKENDDTKNDSTRTSSKRFKLMATWNPFKSNVAADFFDAKTMFNVNEFQIVIGNPPYVQLASMKEVSKNLYKPQGFKTYEATGDLYCLFLEKGIELCSKKGLLTFITSNKWMRAKYGEKLRAYLAKENPILLIDFGGTKVFDSATVDTNIIQVVKERNEGKTISCNVSLNKSNMDKLDNLSDYIQQNSTTLNFDSSNSWVVLSTVESSIKQKIEKVGIPLKDWNIQINYGIKTGLNDAFIIDEKKRSEILSNCLTVEERKKTEQIIRPILRGKDICQYCYNWKNLYLCWIPWHFPCHLDSSIQGASVKAEKAFHNEYPALYHHLLNYKDMLSKRNEAETGIRYEWYALQRWGANYWDEFSKPKIIYPNMTKYMPFVYDDEGFVTNQKCFIITGENIAYLTLFFNSSLFKYCFRDSFPELLGGTRELSKVFFDKIPVKKVSDSEHIIALLKDIQDSFSIEKAKVIDNFIFDLYGLTEEEKSIIGYIEIR